jgi:hypothetical protein
MDGIAVRYKKKNLEHSIVTEVKIQKPPTPTSMAFVTANCVDLLE